MDPTGPHSAALHLHLLLGEHFPEYQMQYDTHTFTILKYPGIVDPLLSAPPAEKMEKCNLWMNYNQLNPRFTKTMNQQKNTMSQAIKTNRSSMMIIHTSGRTLIGPVHLHYLGETILQKPRRLDDKSTPFSSIQIDGSKKEWRNEQAVFVLVHALRQYQLP